MVRSRENLVGAYAFSIGIILSVVLGIFNESLEYADGLFYSVLILIGIIVGYVTVSDRNSVTFLLASLSIVIVGGVGTEPLLFVAKQNLVVNLLRNILATLMVLFVPATIIVALKTVFSLAKV